MTIHRASIVVLVLSAQLAIATLAHAAPGWTLWAHTSSEINGVPLAAGGAWDPLQTAPTEGDCRAAIDTTIAATFGYLSGKFEASGAKVTMEGTTVVTKWVDDKGRRLTRLHHVCLPDTVDPRGPKGGK